MATGSDVWGLGAVLFEALTGIPPFEDPDEVEWSTTAGSSPPSATGSGAEGHEHRQLEVLAPPVGRYRRGVPGAMSDLVAACLRPEPAARPSIAAVLAALEPLAKVPGPERRWATGSEPGRARPQPAGAGTQR